MHIHARAVTANYAVYVCSRMRIASTYMHNPADDDPYCTRVLSCEDALRSTCTDTCMQHVCWRTCTCKASCQVMHVHLNAVDSSDGSACAHGHEFAEHCALLSSHVCSRARDTHYHMLDVSGWRQCATDGRAYVLPCCLPAENQRNEEGGEGSADADTDQANKVALEKATALGEELTKVLTHVQDSLHDTVELVSRHPMNRRCKCMHA